MYLDDILVTGATEEEHLSALEEVLRRMSKQEFRLRREKCVFLVLSVVYLGHKIDAQSLHPHRFQLFQQSYRTKTYYLNHAH